MAGYCATCTVDWTAATSATDTLVNSVIPGDSFKIYPNQTKLNTLKWLFDKTNCVMKVDATGTILIIIPFTTGTTYDYEYALTTGHAIYDKGIDNALVIPNKVTVSSKTDDTVQASGTAASSTSFGRVPIEDFVYTTLSGANTTEMAAMAGSIATAIITKAELNAQQGSAKVPMNIDSDIYDYVKATDDREGTTITGNIGYQKFVYAPMADNKDDKWYLQFSFGSYLDNKYKSLITDLENEPNMPFSRIVHGDMYIENLHADKMNFTWLDPENNIDLSLIGDTLDGLADGAAYARVKSTALNSSGMVTVDALIDGTYARVLATALSAGQLKLTSDTKVDGKWYSQHGVDIAASVGINIYGENNALVTRATETGTIQCAVNSSGQITAGAGALKLDVNGLTIQNLAGTNNFMRFNNSAGVQKAEIYLSALDNVYINGDEDVTIQAVAGSLYVNADALNLDTYSTPIIFKTAITAAASTANIQDHELAMFLVGTAMILYWRDGTTLYTNAFNIVI